MLKLSGKSITTINMIKDILNKARTDLKDLPEIPVWNEGHKTAQFRMMLEEVQRNIKALDCEMEEEWWKVRDLALKISGRVEDIIHEFVPESLIADACTITHPGGVEVVWDPQEATTEERTLWANSVAEKVRKVFPGEEIELHVEPTEHHPACVLVRVNPKEPAKFLERIMAPIETLAS
jgi:hypothetical protein